MLPSSLVVAALSVLAVAVLDLDQHGLDIVGPIDSGLPRVGLPDVGLQQLLDLVFPAVGVMLVGFAEGLGAAKTYAAKTGDTIDANKELVGLGAANLGAGMCSGMVVNGSLSKTAVNGGAGARSQVSGLTVALLTVVTLLFLTGLFEQLPEPTLAAIVVAAVVELVDVASLRRLWDVQTGRLASIYHYTSRADFIAALAALLGVLVFDTLPGLVIGIAVSLVLLIARTSRPHVATLVRVPDRPAGTGASSPVWADAARHPDLVPPKDVLVLRVEAALFFGNADYVRDRVRALVAAPRTTPLRLVVLDGETTPSIDVTSAAMLVQLREDLGRDGVALVLAGGIGQVRDVLATAEAKGEPPIYRTIEAALDADPVGDPQGRSPASGEPRHGG